MKASQLIVRTLLLSSFISLPLGTIAQNNSLPQKTCRLNTVIGTGIGTTAGAIIGGAAASAPVIGGIIGGGLGFAFGSTYQNKFFIQHGVNIVTLDDKIIILIPTDKLFEPDSQILVPDADEILDMIIKLIHQYPNDHIYISAHADPIGTKQHNLTLTDQQAAQVAGYFWTHGIPRTDVHQQLTFSGEGKNQPIATNQKLNGMALNRRIQVTFSPPIINKLPQCQPIKYIK